MRAAAKPMPPTGASASHIHSRSSIAAAIAAA